MKQDYTNQKTALDDAYNLLIEHGFEVDIEDGIMTAYLIGANIQWKSSDDAVELTITED